MQMKRIFRIEEMVQKRDEFCRIKKMFLPITENIAEMLHELQQPRQDTEYTVGWARSFECHLGRAVGRKVKLARA